MTLVGQIALSEICLHISDMAAEGYPGIPQAYQSVMRIFCHAAVTSQLRIPSLTPSHTSSISSESRALASKSDEVVMPAGKCLTSGVTKGMTLSSRTPR